MTEKPLLIPLSSNDPYLDERKVFKIIVFYYYAVRQPVHETDHDFCDFEMLREYTTDHSIEVGDFGRLY